MASRKPATYRVKRDFSRTAEPSGSGGAAPSEHLCFVVQKHAARRLHWPSVGADPGWKSRQITTERRLE